MGIYLNPGNDLFQEALNSEIYIDKSMLFHTQIKKSERKIKISASAAQEDSGNPWQLICWLHITAVAAIQRNNLKT